jgi:hypothetical protein
MVGCPSSTQTGIAGALRGLQTAGLPVLYAPFLRQGGSGHTGAMSENSLDGERRKPHCSRACVWPRHGQLRSSRELSCIPKTSGRGTGISAGRAEWPVPRDSARATVHVGWLACSVGGRRGCRSRWPAFLIDSAVARSELWRARLQKLRANDRMYGVVFATTRAAINEFASGRGVSKLTNVNGCPG